jgi:hypothetical protein
MRATRAGAALLLVVGLGATGCRSSDDVAGQTFTSEVPTVGGDVPDWVTDLVGALPEGHVDFATRSAFRYRTPTASRVLIASLADTLGDPMAGTVEAAFWQLGDEGSVTVAGLDAGGSSVNVGR